VTAIGEAAFSGCSSLSAMTIPASVTEIGSNAFIECAEDLTLTGAAGSAASSYAEENAIIFVEG
jgi:hypothetical protein